jgi:hypothetical protein
MEYIKCMNKYKVILTNDMQFSVPRARYKFSEKNFAEYESTRQ